MAPVALWTVLASTAHAAGLSWICLPIAQPADALPYRPARDGLGAAEAGRSAYAALLARVDAACVSDCADPEAECPARTCVTAAGDTVEWSAETTASSDATSSSSARTVRVAVTASADGGLGWTWAEVTYVAGGSSWSGSAWSSGETWSVAWRGTLDADWPEDGAFTASEGSSHSDSDEAWDDGACGWSVKQDVAGNVSVHVNGTSVWVSSPWEVIACGDPVGLLGGTYAEVDGVFGGLVDTETWAYLVGTDADGDGWLAEHGDCDDGNAAVGCHATDAPYDGVDQDCDGADLRDADGDGWEGDGGPDCDDTARGVHPGADDHDVDGVDADCDGVDGVDADGDGWAPPREGRRETPADDCDDADPSVHPLADETWRDGVDSDCDGSDGVFGQDADGDGWADDEDCDPANPEVNPGAREHAGRDRTDQDCDGVDGLDTDGDGFDPFDDCDPDDADVHPGAAEVPGDGVDQDCDGIDASVPGSPDGSDAGDADGARCGCATGGAAAAWPWVAALGLLVARRRRYGSSCTASPRTPPVPRAW